MIKALNTNLNTKKNLQYCTIEGLLKTITNKNHSVLNCN